MALSAASTMEPGMNGGGHGFHPLRVTDVVRETAEASSFVFEAPEGPDGLFAYDAGQFCTFRVWVDGRAHLRCYSMSSAPGVDARLQVTVKRVPGGVVSNWMNDVLAPGDVVEASRPAGTFRLADDDTTDLVAFAGGSGITPVLSLVKAALAGTSRRVRLLYANRDAEVVIFAGALRALAERHPGRLDVVHHLDALHGIVTADAVRPWADASPGGRFYVCGPGPFMDIVESTLLAHGVAPERVLSERFVTPAAPEPPAAPAPPADEPGPLATRVTIALAGRTDTTDHRPGTTILQTARQMGMDAPFSCEAGNCATCMARLVEGEVEMFTNNALTDDEVAEGWVLTCQAVPTSPSVSVIYGYD
jgi:ferredoxin-NADP reductase